ncbi:MAG: hypothetical protein Tsb009_23390 [Planctomycetaceae bacterium]
MIFLSKTARLLMMLAVVSLVSLGIGCGKKSSDKSGSGKSPSAKTGDQNKSNGNGSGGKTGNDGGKTGKSPGGVSMKTTPEKTGRKIGSQPPRKTVESGSGVSKKKLKRRK